MYGRYVRLSRRYVARNLRVAVPGAYGGRPRETNCLVHSCENRREKRASVARAALKALKVTVSFEDPFLILKSDLATRPSGFRGLYLGETELRASIARGNGLSESRIFG